MAVNSLATVISGLQRPQPFIKPGGSADGVQGQLVSYWQYSGYPKAGGFDNTLNGVVLSGSSTQVAGQLPFVDPDTGNCYLAKLRAACWWVTASTAGSPNGVLYLCDRLWHNGNIDTTITTAQNITTPTWPARDLAGTTNGDGVFICMEPSVATVVNTGAMTISYTNSAGTSGRTGNVIVAGTHNRNNVWEFDLQAGDTGVRSVQSLTLGTAPSSGTLNLVAYRVIATLPMPIGGKTYRLDAPRGNMPQLYAGSVPYFMVRQANISGSTGLTIAGEVGFTWG